MSTPQFKSRDAMSVYAFNYAARRAKLDGRFKRLKGGPDVRQSVIDEAALRLLEPPVDPVELLPKPLQKKMRQPLPEPIGNVQLHRSPLESPRWVAFVKVYGQLFELGEFWNVKGKELDELVDLRVRKAREAYIHETRYTSKASDETINQEQQENLARLTEAGQERAGDAVKQLENQTQELAEENLIAAQRVLRAKVEAVEDARVCVAGVEYYNKLPFKQRQVFHLVCAGQSDSQIADQLGVARATARLVRAILVGFADQFQTLPPYDEEGGASPVEVPVAVHAPHDESKLDTRIADIIDEENASAWSTGGAEKLHLPEIDRADDSTIHIRRTRVAMGDCKWRGGGSRPSASAMMSGYEYRNATSEDQVFFEHKERLRDAQDMPISEAAESAIRKLAEKLGLDAEQLLKSAALRMSLSADEGLASTIEGPKTKGVTSE
jgi:hypothetical protein